MRILITGYAGFIGSNLTRQLLRDGHEVMGLDCMTYAARPQHVADLFEDNEILARFHNEPTDLRDPYDTQQAILIFRPDQVYHLAAESHVCRSIDGPKDFATTNFMGTFNLIEALRKSDFKGRMVHVSTDEAFGELEMGEKPFDESTNTDPRSPYSASKAASDLMVRAYQRTYGLDFLVTRCTNNYGPNQHEEKLIPRAILRFLRNDPMTIYGNGTHVRDWIHVDDHARALKTAMRAGKSGDLYCIGSGLELPNIEVVKLVAAAVKNVTGNEVDCALQFTNDRPTDDRRYAVTTDKVKALGWQPNPTLGHFKRKLMETVEWYIQNGHT